MFDDLMTIIDCKIALYAARHTSDGGLGESIRESELIKEFREKHLPSAESEAAEEEADEFLRYNREI